MVTCDATGSTVRDVSLAIPVATLVCLDLRPVRTSGSQQRNDHASAVDSTITLAATTVSRKRASVGTDSVTVRYCDATNNCATGRLAIASRPGLRRLSR